MRRRQFACIGLLFMTAVGGRLASAGQQGVGQVPSSLPLTAPIRERGSSVSPAYEGWYYDKDGSVRLLVGYFNRNTKQEFDIPVGPNNRIEPGGPDQGQPTHFAPGRQWGVFSVKVPKDFGAKKLTWTLVANGFTNTITLHTQPDYIVEPFGDAANKNTPPSLKFKADGPAFMGAPNAIAEKLTATAGAPLALIVWASDEGPKINIPESRAAGRGRGAGGRGEPPGRGGAAGRDAIPAEFQPAPPLAVTWSVFRAATGGAVKFDNPKPDIDKADGKATVQATFSAPGEYVLRVEGNDSTGVGGGGFQCCWTTAHVSVTVKPAAGTGG
jgi:hypothetical protein